MARSYIRERTGLKGEPSRKSLGQEPKPQAPGARQVVRMAGWPVVAVQGASPVSQALLVLRERGRSEFSNVCYWFLRKIKYSSLNMFANLTWTANLQKVHMRILCFYTIFSILLVIFSIYAYKRIRVCLCVYECVDLCVDTDT